MLATVARHAPSIIAGSALAGFGLSLGRDVYRKAKKRWPLIVILLCLVGVFFGSMWLFRNYRTATGSIFKKLGLCSFFPVLASCSISLRYTLFRLSWYKRAYLSLVKTSCSMGQSSTVSCSWWGR